MIVPFQMVLQRYFYDTKDVYIIRNSKKGELFLYVHRFYRKKTGRPLMSLPDWSSGN